MKLRSLLLSTAIALLSATVAFGQYYNNDSNRVGGVSIDANGLVNNVQKSESAKLVQAQQAALQPIAEDLQKASPARKISLKAINEAVANAKADGQTIPDAVAFLGGLTKIEFVVALPEQNDIVLIGPAEPWKIGNDGSPVGTVTGAPIMLLEDLATAIHTCAQAQRGPMSCSIDPTPEGMKNLHAFASRLTPNMNPAKAAQRIEQVVGNQSVRVMGVNPTTHFAQVMVSSDYQMKQISMGVRPAAVENLPPFTKFVEFNTTGAQNAMPRWWLAPNYGAVLRDQSGLTWQIQGGSVKTMCEADFYAGDGVRQQGKAKVASGYQKWADVMTDRYADLSKAEPVFGQLRNCMDSAVVGALIVKENMMRKVGNAFTDVTELTLSEFNEPKEVPCMAAVNKARRVTIVCGGVDIDPWLILNNVQVKADLKSLSANVEFEEGSFYAN